MASTSQALPLSLFLSKLAKYFNELARSEAGSHFGKKICPAIGNATPDSNADFAHVNLGRGALISSEAPVCTGTDRTPTVKGISSSTNPTPMETKVKVYYHCHLIDDTVFDS